METDADRLRKLLANVPNQAQFAKDNRVPGGASMVSQHLSGHRPISLEAAIAYSRAFQVPMAAVSPRCAALIAEGAAQLDAATMVASRPAPKLEAALPLVLDAIAAAPDRASLRTAMQAFLEDPAAAYRARLTELLTAAPRAHGPTSATPIGPSGKHRRAA